LKKPNAKSSSLWLGEITFDVVSLKHTSWPQSLAVTCKLKINPVLSCHQSLCCSRCSLQWEQAFCRHVNCSGRVFDVPDCMAPDIILEHCNVPLLNGSCVDFLKSIRCSFPRFITRLLQNWNTFCGLIFS